MPCFKASDDCSNTYSAVTINVHFGKRSPYPQLASAMLFRLPFSLSESWIDTAHLFTCVVSTPCVTLLILQGKHWNWVPFSRIKEKENEGMRGSWSGWEMLAGMGKG